MQVEFIKIEKNIYLYSDLIKGFVPLWNPTQELRKAKVQKHRITKVVKAL